MTEERVKEKENVVNTTANVEDVLNLIDRVNETFSYGIWVPSLNKEIMFREITTSQQKRLIKSIIDSPVWNTEFIFALRQILIENCVDSDVNVDELTILDKLFIAIKMRSVSIGNSIEIEIPIEDGDNIKRGISLDKITNKIKKTLSIPKPLTITSVDNIYTLECSMPTIGTEYTLENELRKNTDIENIESADELRKTIGDTFINELVKYINTLSILSDGKITTIDLNSISFKNRITMIGKLPAKLLDNVINYIGEISKELDKITMIDVSYTQDGEKKNVKERLTIDGNFFTSS